MNLNPICTQNRHLEVRLQRLQDNLKEEIMSNQNRVTKTALMILLGRQISDARRKINNNNRLINIELNNR